LLAVIAHLLEVGLGQTALRRIPPPYWRSVGRTPLAHFPWLPSDGDRRKMAVSPGL